MNHTDGTYSDVTSMAEWHGYAVGRESLHIGMLPGYKRPYLYMVCGNEFTPLAYFRSERFARSALRLLDRIARGSMEE